VGSLLTRLPLPGRTATDTGRSADLWWAAAAAAGVTVLGLFGLAGAVLVVETLDPGSGLSFGGSLALAGRLWLLANGGQLALSSGPLVLAPLLLTAAIAWSLSRTTRAAVAAGAADSRVGLQVLTAALVHVVLTLLLGVVLDSRTAGVGFPRTLLGAALLAFAAAGWGAARESGGLDAALDRLPGPARPVLRGALAGGLTALGLCTAVVALAVAADAHGYATLSASLGGAGAAALGLLALGLLLLPNAAAAALGMAAGPGFVVGSGTVVSVHGVTLGAVPALPLLAALPDTRAVPLVVLASQAVPAVAGLVAGVTLGRWLSDDDGGSVIAGLSGVVAGVLLGVGGAVLTWAAGGSLGDGALGIVGAPPLATGVALGAQCGIAAALAAAVTRWRSPA
jgi:hypothetical protein